MSNNLPSDDTFHLFVYGSLMRGGERHWVLAGERWLGVARTRPRYALFNLIEYPGMVSCERDGMVVHGELYVVASSLIPELDKVEGAPDLFRLGPVVVDGIDEPVYAYLYQQDTRCFARCESGRWLEPQGSAVRRPMTHADAFLQAIAENPDDDGLRLIYADWLEERDDPRGAFIRVQVELSHLLPDDPRRPELLARKDALFAAHEREWLGDLHGLVEEGEFHNGFLEKVTIQAEVFLERAEELFSRSPVRQVFLRGALGVMRRLVQCPHLRRLTGLDLHGNVLTDAEAAELAQSPYLDRLEFLDLGNNDIGDWGASALARSAGFPLLQRLDLRLNRLRVTAAALANSPRLHNLIDLNLEGNQIGNAGLRVLAASPTLTGLKALRLGNNTIDGTGMADLVRSCELSRLEKLDLHWNPLGEAGIGALAHSPIANSLTRLHLSYCTAGDAGARALAESSRLTRLTELHLAHDQITDMGLRRLLASPLLARLTTLDLSQNYIGDDGVRLIAHTGLPERLTLLDLRGNHLSVQALREQESYPRLRRVLRV